MKKQVKIILYLINVGLWINNGIMAKMTFYFKTHIHILFRADKQVRLSCVKSLVEINPVFRIY